ncbi:MAG TPA: hypothetical protein VIB48_02475 [Acidimicrobiia bacterium]
MTYSRADRWTTTALEADALARLVGALRARRAKIVERDDRRVEAHIGSQLLARLDVSLVPKRWLPLHVEVTVARGDGTDARTAVEVSIEDALGVGAAGTSSRYDELFDETLAALRSATP